MDFIEGLPTSRGKDTILVVANRLTKYGHFMALYHHFSALIIAQAYLGNICKLHVLPKSIEHFKRIGTHLHLSTVYHLESDRQTKVLNRCLESYLRRKTRETIWDWCCWLTLAEWWYNSTFHSTIQTTPYKTLYGLPPTTFTLTGRLLYY
ncbi:reverse transcriptase [Gossypium australe]|uniref:Reverse transcriptase n=1 Tax=Gossypium australe TaxID=47621 RepID=A0A5B6WX79_9ROSI|nr:reverse transcriptase [Gossypium australe]